MLLCVGLAYGLSTSLADWSFAAGMNMATPIKDRIDHFRQAAKYNPFDHNSRMVGATILALAALQSHDQGWLNAARSEVRYRLETDSTDANLLLSGMMLSLELGNTKEADFYYAQFKRVDKKSPLLIGGVKPSTGSSAVAPVP